MNDFEEAKEATTAMFTDEPAEDIENAVEDIPTDEPDNEEGAEPTVDMETPEMKALDNATVAAEQAAQAVAERDMQLQQLQQQVAAISEQNKQLQGTIDEMSRRNEEKLIEEVLEPPVIDVNALAFADEATVSNAQAEYARKMAEYVRGPVMKELEPFIERAKEGERVRERDEVIAGLAQVPQMAGIDKMVPQLERIIQNIPALASSDMDTDEKYITAYTILKGINAIDAPPPKEPDADELMELYNKNPDFQAAVEKQRLSQIKDSQQVPPFSASSGAVNAALNIKDKPKTFDEASERTRRMFGM